jgi:hypothetical protein
MSNQPIVMSFLFVDYQLFMKINNISYIQTDIYLIQLEAI